MADHPSVELLESTHSFPGEYMFKAFGKADGPFAGDLIAAVRSEIAPEHEPSMRIRKTVSGRHVCVTIEPVVNDANQVLAIYERIYALDGLVMVW